MADTTVVGRTTFVRGRIAGDGDLEIGGRVEGDVTCSGEVTVEASGLVASNIAARRIVVRGAVKGDLTAEEAIVVESSAKVAGDLRAPSIRIVQGGLVRGYVQTAGAGAAARPRAAHATRPAASSATASASASASAPRAAATAARPAPAAKAAPPPPRSSKEVSRNNGQPPRGATLAGARPHDSGRPAGRPGPPPPVVPALKKGTKAHQKKR